MTTTPRTVRDAFHHLTGQALAKATSLQLMGEAADPWKNVAGMLAEWTGWSTLPPAEGQATPICAYAGRAHAGHVKWALATTRKVAEAVKEADALGLRVWMTEQLAGVPLVADDKALPALWLWSALARQAQAHAQALPQPVRDESGRTGIMRGSLFVPMPPPALQQIQAQAMHLAQVREGIVGDLGMMLEYLNPARHLHVVAGPPAGRVS